jgi:hypothetical protein
MEKLRSVVSDEDPKALYSKIKKVGQGWVDVFVLGFWGRGRDGYGSIVLFLCLGTIINGVLATLISFPFLFRFPPYWLFLFFLPSYLFLYASTVHPGTSTSPNPISQTKKSRSKKWTSLINRGRN